MSEAVLYCDVTFTKSRERIKDTASLNETTYSEVNISKMQPFTEPPVASQQVLSNTGSKVTTERVSRLVFGVLLIAAVIGLGVVSITGENAQYRKCGRCWEPHGGKCYYFSSGSLFWQQSRDNCISWGGDLVKIDSREEQRFLEERVRKEMKNDQDHFWIGLTDSVEEGKWVWVDGSPLNQSLTFWSLNEPDNYRGESHNGEDCVRMGERGGAHDLKSWYDRACDREQRRICEKSAETEF